MKTNSEFEVHLHMLKIKERDDKIAKLLKQNKDFKLGNDPSFKFKKNLSFQERLMKRILADPTLIVG